MSIVAHSCGESRSARSAAVVVFPDAFAPVVPVPARVAVGRHSSAPITTSEGNDLAKIMYWEDSAGRFALSQSTV